MIAVMRPILTMVLAAALVTAAAFAARAEKDPEESLSPYFFIQDDESAADHFTLEQTDVQVRIAGVIAHVTVQQTYVNRGARPLSATYIFPAATRAAVHGMRMTIGERVITARIQEKATARKTYQEAKAAGKSASLLQQQRPNVFSMAVANILPGDTIAIELEYTELLVPTDSVYRFVYPTVVGPRYSSLTEDEASPDDQWVKNPYLPQGTDPQTRFNITVSLNAGLPIQDVRCPSHATRVQWQGEKTASIELADPTRFGGDRDYVLAYRLDGDAIQTGLMTYTQDGETFFLLMAQPPRQVVQAQIPDREYIFVVDVSGSMSGFPLDTAKALLADLIGHLRSTDRFNVILFAGGSQAMAPSPVAATAEHVRQAVGLIDDQRGGGGTELLAAVQRALAMPRAEGVSRSLVIVTDGFIQAEKELFGAITDHLDRMNVFAFGIGSSVNRYLIEGIARAGAGEPFVVTEPAEAPGAASRFRDYIAAPLLTEIQVSFEGFEAYDVEPPQVPDLFARRPVIVMGKWREPVQGSVVLTGISGSGPHRETFAVAGDSALAENAPLRYLWARSRMARLSDFNSQADDPENRAEITALGLTYNLLSQYTAFVAVDEVIRNPGGESQTVKQPLPLPKGVSNAAVGVSVSRVPEPELMDLLALALPMLLLLIAARRPWMHRRTGQRGDRR